MNQDVRQDHTMRNALLLVGGTAALAAGGVAGVKALEKNAKKISKAAASNTEKATAESVTKKAETKVKAANSTSTKTNSKNIKTNPKKTTNAKPELNVAKRISELQEFEQKLEKMIKEATSDTERKKLIKTLEFVKSEIAQLKLKGSNA